MASLAQTSLLTPVVSRLPRALVSLLDAWSQRIARQHAEKRREAGRRRAEARAKRHIAT